MTTEATTEATRGSFSELLQRGFRCPENMRSHLATVWAGEYDVPGLSFDPAPTVLDLGANCGAFALWALERWPGATVHCYEPQEEAFEDLAANLCHLLGLDQGGAHLYRQAVGDPGLKRLFHGRNNPGEAGLYPGACRCESDYEEVETISPGALPRAHVVKMDIEGAELVTLAGLRFAPVAILLEYHHEALRRSIDALLGDYTLIGGQVYEPGRGVLKYVQRAILRRECEAH